MAEQGFLCRKHGRNDGATRPYAFYGPHYTDVDTALSKFIPLHEALQLEARAECFNCFNHTNYANPGGAINSAGTGVTNPGQALSSKIFGNHQCCKSSPDSAAQPQDGLLKH